MVVLCWDATSYRLGIYNVQLLIRSWLFKIAYEARFLQKWEYTSGVEDLWLFLRLN